MRVTPKEQAFLLAVAGATIYICWNCRITPSTIILIVILSAFLFACVCPGMESFLESTKPSTIHDAGILGPNLFDCMNLIGNSAKDGYHYADPKN
jgi:hypothetical protein